MKYYLLRFIVFLLSYLFIYLFIYLSFYSKYLKKNRTQESFKIEPKSLSKYSTDCTSQNVIYLIECKRCNMQYIGQTNQQVSKRMNSHRFDINTYDGQSYATNVALHLNSDSHSLNDFRFLPIDVVKNEMDRLCKETYWIHKLDTLHSKSMNSKLLYTMK